MRRLIYSMTVSLDGFIAGPGGDIGWSAPDEELHRFHDEQVRELGTHLLGRRLYETMVVWEPGRDESSVTEAHPEFARTWRALPKVVFSSTLETVVGNTRLATDSLADEVARLREQPGKDLAVGGAELAGAAARLGLIDEYQMFISPVVLGGGTPYFPPLEQPLKLELLERRTFASAVVFLRYGVER